MQHTEIENQLPSNR